MSEPVQFPASVNLDGDRLVRKYRIPAGTDLVTHEHPYDHLSILVSGEAVLTANGARQLLIGPRFLTIRKGVSHGVFAVTDCVWDCIHSFKAAKESGDAYILDGVKEQA